MVAAAVGHCAGTDDLFMISISVGLVGAGERDKHDDAMGGTSLTPLLNLIADPVVQPRAGGADGLRVFSTEYATVNVYSSHRGLRSAY